MSESKTPSPPINMVNNQQPVQEEMADSISSQLVFSLSKSVSSSYVQQLGPHEEKEEVSPAASSGEASGSTIQEQASLTSPPDEDKVKSKKPVDSPASPKEKEQELTASQFTSLKERKPGMQLPDLSLHHEGSGPALQPTASLPPPAENEEKPRAEPPPTAPEEGLQSATLPNEKTLISNKVYTSREVQAVLHKYKLLQSSKRGHTWSRTIAVQVTKRKEVTIRVFLFPSVSNSNNTDTRNAKLDVTAELKFLDKLLANNEECHIRVQSEIMDVQAGHSVGSTEFPSYRVSEDDGKVSYRQDLASCDRIKECRGDSVTLYLKATATISPQERYDIHDVDGFAVVDKVNSV